MTSPDDVRARVDALADRLAREYARASASVFDGFSPGWIVRAYAPNGALAALFRVDSRGAYVGSIDPHNLLPTLRAEGLI